MKINKTDFSRIIKDLQLSGLTNREIADISGCSPVFIGQLCNQHRMQPTYDIGRAIVLLHQERT